MNWIKGMRRSSMVALPVLLVSAGVYASPAAQEKAASETRETARQTGNAIKDSWITMKIHSLFVPEDALEGSDIDVDTNAGVVTLTGTVRTDAGRARAIAIAKAADGVKSVNDKLRIGADVAEAREAGRAAGDEAREAGRTAKDAARDVTGTTGKAVTDGWLKSKIASQFVAEDSLDNSDIDIDIERGVVTLNGAVRTDGARTRAAAIAKGTDGVKSVKNNLKVDPKTL